MDEDTLDGLGAADARLGRPFPLPAIALPVARWVGVRAIGDRGAQVEWNLDDTRPGAPGRLALYAGPDAPPAQLPVDAPVRTVQSVRHDGRVLVLTRLPLDAAQSSLRPVVEVAWEQHGLHLRLTAQGPWVHEDVLAIVAAVDAPPCDRLG